MYFSSRRRKEEQEVLEDNVNYPEATVKQYLNLRRTTKDKCCLVSFCVSALVTIMLMGIGLFYGNYTNIGIFVDSSGNIATITSDCPYLDSTYSCTKQCTTGQLYLQKVCILPNQTFTTALQSQIQIYNLKYTYSTMVYSNVGILIGIILCFLIVICYPKTIYFYILIGFIVLLGFSFYLLKSTQTRQQYWNNQDRKDLTNNMIIQDETQMRSLAYILLAAYLFLFPMILFAPRKIQIAVKIISNMGKYFQAMYTVVAFTILLAITAYGLIFLVGFVLMNIFTDGQKTTKSDSFFYLYERVNLTNPGALALFFFGIYWFFGTLISWHKYLIGSSVLQWYFQDGGKLKPVRKGLRRAWFQLGSAAIDSLLTPIQWIVLLFYSITKMESNQLEEDGDGSEDCLCCSNCIYSFRKFIGRAYCKINRNCSSSGPLTNQTFIESCQISAVIFAENKHKFFNIGGSLTLYLALFSILVFVFINYLALYNTIYLSTTPSPISSLSLPIILSFSLGIVIGQILTNLFSASIDCLLFCYLLQKKNGIQYSTNQIKKSLQELYNKEDQIQEVVEMYELEPDQ